MTRTEIDAFVDRCCAALASRDVDAVAALHAESCVMESPTAGGTITGRDAIANVYRLWFDGFPDLTIECDERLIDEDRFVQRITLSGTDNGGFLGIEPTGRAFRVPMVWICRLKGGLIVHSRPVYDFSGVLIQIGVLRAKPA
jgi:steroid delta-isomerase-like uncharacterized protein